VRNRLAAAIGAQEEDEILPGMNLVTSRGGGGGGGVASATAPGIGETDPVLLLDQYAAWSDAVASAVGPAMRRTDILARQLAEALAEERAAFEAQRELVAAGAVLAGQVTAAARRELETINEEGAGGEAAASATVDILHGLRAEFSAALAGLDE
jgi:hypothetical protein